MTTYVRPAVPIAIYRDDAGAPIRYGDRWGSEPPEDSYSRTDNLERFAPLHTIAAALIEWLTGSFDVTVERDTAVAGDLLHAPPDILNAVRLTPRDPLSAPLTFVLTAFPGVCIHAGALHDLHFPVCGCDACDDDVESLVDDLEWSVRTVVGGGYTERLDPSARWVEYRFEDETGMRSGRTQLNEFPVARAKAVPRVLPRSGRWHAWPERR